MFISAGKATIITIGGLAAGAVVGSVVENWLQVDIVPFLGIHSLSVSEVLVCCKICEGNSCMDLTKGLRNIYMSLR